MKAILSASLIASLLPLAAQAYCPPTGPVLPPPSLSKCGANLTVDLKDAMDELTESAGATFSLQVTSKEKTFFEYHHAGAGLHNTSTTDINGDSIYRLASVTKVFTVLALLLQEGVNLDVPASHYVHELDNLPMYKDTTLRMLASQLAGVPRDSYMFDLTSGMTPEDMERFGLPAIEPPPDVPKCDAVTQGEDPCSRSEFFDILNGAGLTWQAGHKAAYSNLAFIIIGFAIQNITGSEYVDVMRDQVTGPLGMDNTGFELPDLSNLVIPDGEGAFFAVMEVHNYNATGGLYSTPNDLNKLIRGILNYELLDNTKTNQWLKPQAFTSSSVSAVGAPWEIFRPTSLVAANRPIDIYTKSGGLPGYNAYVALIPEYEIGLSINVAGAADKDYAIIRDIFSAATQNLVPHLEALARAQAAAKYAGTYSSTAGNATSTMVLSIDDGPGLKIDEWTFNDNNVRTIIAALHRADGPDGLDVRAYPVGVEDRWQLVVEKVATGEDTSVYAGTCETWFSLDQMRFAGLPTDEIGFVVEDGKVVAVTSPGLRQKLDKE